MFVFDGARGSRKYSKSSKLQLYIIIMKPFIEVAGGNHLPAICYAQRGGMAYLGDYHYSKEHWQSNRQEGFAVLRKGGRRMKGIEIALFIIGCGVKLAEIIAEED